MLVRGHEHPPIKKKLIEISDESYVVAALGKIVNYDVEDLNMILGYKNTAISSHDISYRDLKSNKADEVLKIITTCRKKNRLLYRISREIQEYLKIECSSNHHGFVEAPIGKTQHLLFLYDELPDNREVELEIEIPHESMRNKFKE